MHYLLFLPSLFSLLARGIDTLRGASGLMVFISGYTMEHMLLVSFFILPDSCSHNNLYRPLLRDPITMGVAQSQGNYSMKCILKSRYHAYQPCHGRRHHWGPFASLRPLQRISSPLPLFQSTTLEITFDEALSTTGWHTAPSLRHHPSLHPRRRQSRHVPARPHVRH